MGFKGGKNQAKKRPSQQGGFKKQKIDVNATAGKKGGDSKNGSAAKASGKQHKTSSDAGAADTKKEKYVVLIHNVENQMDVIHAESIARHLGINSRLVRSNSNGQVAPSSANYKVSCRTETRSAQVDIFYDDEQGADVLLNPSGGSNVSDKKAKSLNSADAQKKKDGEEDGEETDVNTKRGKRSRSVAEVVERNKGKRYFGVPLRLRVSGSGEANESSKNGEEAADAEAGGLAVSNADEAMHSNHIVGVGCNTNVALGAKQLHNILTDIPGFISCWKTHQPKKFRCVFESEQSLFTAKPLLDQFEVEGVKITLNIPDALTDRFNDFVAARTE